MPIFLLLCTLICLCIPAKADVQFTDVTELSGVEFRHFTGAMGERYMPETMGAGCAFFDYDADGHLDILLANGMAWKSNGTADTPRLYRNIGSGQFTDVTEAAKLNVPMYGMGITVGDYDNDADPDIYLPTSAKTDSFAIMGTGPLRMSPHSQQ